MIKNLQLHWRLDCISLFYDFSVCLCRILCYHNFRNFLLGKCILFINSQINLFIDFQNINKGYFKFWESLILVGKLQKIEHNFLIFT